ncbi:MAG: serine hydrolase [Bacteroidales bacterium]|nr:serine hydrolase [Bacteroidales bacterium]
MKTVKTLMASAAMLLMMQSCSNSKAPVADNAQMPRGEAQAEITAAADKLIATTDTMQGVTLQSVMIAQHGKVIYEKWMNGGDAATPHVMHSVSKSFCATAVGMLVDDGKLSVSDTVINFFPDLLPAEVSDNLKAMTVRDLLTMNCGHETEPSPRGANTDNLNWVEAFLAHPVTKQPGTWYCYNSIGTYMLSAIVQTITGQKVVDFLNARLFEPLHIEKPRWEESPQGINCGGWGLYIKTEDMLKFGQLFLQKGQWEGRQLISSQWVEEASKYQVPSVPAGTRPDEVEAKGLNTDNCAWLLGYGYQMWRCPDNAYRADGARGQYIIVMPDQDTVIAITADSPDLQAELSSIYTYLFPAIKNSVTQ